MYKESKQPSPPKPIVNTSREDKLSWHRPQIFNKTPIETTQSGENADKPEGCGCGSYIYYYS